MPVVQDINATYEKEGYLANVRVFSPSEMEDFRSAFEELENRIGKEQCQIGVMGWHNQEEFIWRMATGRLVLDAISQAIGPNFMLLGSHFFCKYPDPNAKKFVAWHQDVTYWGIDPPEAHSAWIALDDVDVENGCMQVIPGSHKKGILPHGKSGRDGNLLSVDQEVPEELVDSERSVCLEMKSGEMSIHHGMLLHASNPNVSNRRRCGLTVRFVRPYVKQVPSESVKKTYHPILVRGADTHGNFELGTAPFPFPQ